MTNAVVWIDRDSSKVWAVADSLLTAQTTSAGHTSISRVTDQAMKVLRLQVGAWGTLPSSIVGAPGYLLRRRNCICRRVNPCAYDLFGSSNDAP